MICNFLLPFFVDSLSICSHSKRERKRRREREREKETKRERKREGVTK